MPSDNQLLHKAVSWLWQKQGAALAFEPRWAPAVVAVELAGAHAEVRLVVTNMWGDQTLLDVDCDE